MPRETFDYIHKPHKLEMQNAKSETVQVPITKLWHDWPDRRFYEDGFILAPDNPGQSKWNYAANK